MKKKPSKAFLIIIGVIVALIVAFVIIGIVEGSKQMKKAQDIVNATSNNTTTSSNPIEYEEPTEEIRSNGIDIYSLISDLSKPAPMTDEMADNITHDCDFWLDTVKDILKQNNDTAISALGNRATDEQIETLNNLYTNSLILIETLKSDIKSVCANLVGVDVSDSSYDEMRNKLDEYAKQVETYINSSR